MEVEGPGDRAGALPAWRRIRQLDSTPGAACERRMRSPGDAPLRPPAPSLPAWEGKSVLSRRGPSVRVLPTAAGPL